MSRRNYSRKATSSLVPNFESKCRKEDREAAIARVGEATFYKNKYRKSVATEDETVIARAEYERKVKRAKETKKKRRRLEMMLELKKDDLGW